MLRRFLSASRGTVAVLTGITLPILFGFTSLGVEVGNWYLVQREMQGASDAAAISAAASFSAGESTYQTVGYTFASTNGFCDLTKIAAAKCAPNSSNKDVTVTVNPINAQNQIV